MTTEFKMPSDYTVYFELYGKKMKVMVIAENENDAKAKVHEKLIVHKVVRSETKFNQCVDICEAIDKELDKITQP